MPPGIARRANGLDIDFITTPEGPALKNDNPNEPPRVKRLSATELRHYASTGA